MESLFSDLSFDAVAFLLVTLGVIVGFLASTLVNALDYVCDYFKALKKSKDNIKPVENGGD